MFHWDSLSFFIPVPDAPLEMVMSESFAPSRAWNVVADAQQVGAGEIKF